MSTSPECFHAELVARIDNAGGIAKALAAASAGTTPGQRTP